MCLMIAIRVPPDGDEWWLLVTASNGSVVTAALDMHDSARLSVQCLF